MNRGKLQGVPKTHFQNAVGATLLLTKTKPVKAFPSHVHEQVKFSPIALTFGYDFVLLVHFWDTL